MYAIINKLPKTSPATQKARIFIIMEMTEIKFMPKESKIYLGSPALLKLPDGALLVTHDYFGPGILSPEQPALTSVYRSEDGGETWSNISQIIGCFWGTLFLHRNEIYLLSVTREYGDLVIRKSTDGGYTWTNPTNEKNGLLLKSGPGHKAPNWHSASATGVYSYKGRLFKSLEELIVPEEGGDALWRPDLFSASVISADENSDLLDAASWTRSNSIMMESQKFPPELNLHIKHGGWLEGNFAEPPEGGLLMLMRVHLAHAFNRIAHIKVSDDGRNITFSHTDGVVEFIGGTSKFNVIYDEKTKCYFSLSHGYLSDEFEHGRHNLYLVVSEDFKHWRTLKKLLCDDTGLDKETARNFTGFQYPDFLIDGEDLLYVVRTAYKGAHTFHDSNRITFHKERNFRNLLNNNEPDFRSENLQQVSEKQRSLF